MKSMTGFGKSETEAKNGKIVIEARSENHRFLEIKFHIPESALSFEQQLSDVVKKVVLRGKIRVSVNIEEAKSNSYMLNEGLVRQSKKNLEKLKKELGVDEQIRLEHILSIKDIFLPEANPDLSKKQALEIARAVSKAIRKLDETRKSEGGKLEKDLKERVNRIENIVQKIRVKRSDFMKNASSKIKERIQKLLEDSQVDECRLYQETAFLAERSDVTEELVRLKAHLAKFRETMAQKGSIGKELDFLLQEINREAGTISAKAKDAEISHLVIDLRSELEKIREQVQNIE